MSVLVLRCPHCGRASLDLFEALNYGVMGTILCESCGNRFRCLLLECLSCANEDIFAWIHVPSEDTLNQLDCSSCGRCLRAEGQELGRGAA